MNELPELLARFRASEHHEVLVTAFKERLQEQIELLLCCEEDIALTVLRQVRSSLAFLEWIDGKTIQHESLSREIAEYIAGAREQAYRSQLDAIGEFGRARTHRTAQPI